MIIQEEVITPKTAEKYLKTMRVNRVLRPSNLAMFCKLITTGQFKNTHQGIAFDTNGNLIDGQHRLLAVVKTDQSVIMQVARGADPETFRALDMGAKRNFSDVLNAGEKNGKTITEVCSCALRIVGRRDVTPEDVKMVLDAKGDSIRELLDFCGTSKRTLSAAPVKLACCYWMENGDRTRAKKLYRDLVLMNFDSLPPVAHAFIRQTIEATKRMVGGSNTIDLFCRAMVVFDPQKEGLTKIQITDQTTAVGKIREWLDR